jgi:hypothetical protein
MQLAHLRRGVTLLTVLLIALFAVGNAYADSKTVSDGNDRPGLLDIRSASHAHDGARIVHTISTFSRWRLGVLGPKTSNLFALEISTDSDPALERVVLVFSKNGHLVAPIVRLPSGAVVGSASASKPNGRTVRISIPRSLFGAGYRWNAHSQYRKAGGACSEFCIDRAPNSGRILHDIAAPTIQLTSFPAIPLDVEYDVSFTISDKGGAGLDSWELQYRPFGTSSWTTVESGTTGGLKTHHQVSAEDNDDEYRVVAIDRHGNEAIRERLVSVPIDDTSGQIVYSGTWTHGPGDPLDFRDTLSTTVDGFAEVALTFTGQYVAWVAPGAVDGASAQLTVDTTGYEVDLTEFSGRRRIVFQHTFANVGTHTISIQLLSSPATLPIDGFIVR